MQLSYPCEVCLSCSLLSCIDEPCKTDGEHEIELLFPFMKDSRAEGKLF